MQQQTAFRIYVYTLAKHLKLHIVLTEPICFPFPRPLSLGRPLFAHGALSTHLGAIPESSLSRFPAFHLEVPIHGSAF